MVYCMSDIHGETDKFRAMLDMIQFSADDTLYIIGDVIDRQPGGVEILQQIMETPNMRMILGNHEEMCLNTLGINSVYGARELWKQNGGNCTYREMVYHLDKQQRYEILHFIAQLPDELNIEVNGRKFHLVHGWPSDDHDVRVWGRPMDGNPLIVPEGVTPIIGHTPTLFLKSKEEQLALLEDMDSHFRIHHEPNAFICIDCGCGNVTPKRRLACFRLDDMSEYYV